MEEINRGREWGDLPIELKELIRELMDCSRVDRLRLRSVCSTWRSSLPPPCFETETRLVSLKHPDSLPGFSSFLKEASICRIQLTTNTLTDDHHNKQQASSTKSTSWLIKVVESSKGRLRLLHSLTYVQLETPPSPLPLSLDNASFVPVVARYVSMDAKPCRWARRIALFPPTARLADKDFGVLLICDEGRLMYWRLRNRSWKQLDDKNIHYQDLAVRNWQYYLVDMVGRVWWINGNLSLVQYSLPLPGCGSRKNLVESQGELYVVDWIQVKIASLYQIDYKWKLVEFGVYRLDEEWGKWEKVKSLGDRSFVLGPDCSFSFDAMELFGGKGNCIYFTDDDKCQIAKPSIWESAGLFRLEDGSIERLVRLPEYSQMLWPPGLQCV